MSEIKRSDLNNYIGKEIFIEYHKNEYLTGQIIVNEWLKNKVKLTAHDPTNQTITFEDSTGKSFTWDYKKFRSILSK